MSGVACFSRSCTSPVIGQCHGVNGTPCGQFYCAGHSEARLCAECAAVKARTDAEQARQLAERERVVARQRAEEAAQAEAERRFADYCATAEWVHKPSKDDWREYRREKGLLRTTNHICNTFVLIAWLAMIASYASGSSIGSSIADIAEINTFLTIYLAIVFSVIAYAIGLFLTSPMRAVANKRILERRIEEATKGRPGFAEFYQAWEVQQKAQKTQASRESLKRDLAMFLGAASLVASIDTPEKRKNDAAMRNIVRGQWDKVE